MLCCDSWISGRRLDELTWERNGRKPQQVFQLQLEEKESEPCQVSTTNQPRNPLILFPVGPVPSLAKREVSPMSCSHCFYFETAKSDYTVVVNRHQLSGENRTQWSILEEVVWKADKAHSYFLKLVCRTFALLIFILKYFHSFGFSNLVLVWSW